MSGRRVCIITPKLAGMDGISAVTREVIGAFTSDDTFSGGADVLSLSDSNAELRSFARNSTSLCTSNGSRIQYAARGCAAAFGKKFDLVVALHLQLAPVAVPLYVRGAKLAIFIHGIEAWQPLRLRERVAVRAAGMVIANSQFTIDKFINTNPECSGSHTAVCPLGIPEDVDFVAPEFVNGPFALIVGRMARQERYKGHDVLIELWPKVCESFPEARLVIAGDGDDRPRLEGKARRSGMAGRVTFTGRISDEVLAGLYQECSFFVMPSTHEGFGLVFAEAMRAGKPCVGAIGAASEVIEDCETGFLVDPARPEDLLGVIVRVFGDDELRRRLGVAGRVRFEKFFSRERFRSRFQALMACLVGRDHGPIATNFRRV